MTEGDTEHKAFEAFCKNNNMDRTQHPLHLLYLNNETSAALKIFKSGFSAASTVDAISNVIADLPPEDQITIAELLAIMNDKKLVAA